MALSLFSAASGNSGTSNTASLGGGNQPAKPNVGDVVIFYVYAQTAGTTFSTPTDNSSGGGAWNSLGYLNLAGTASQQAWYKIANAADHANLSSYSCLMSGSVGWNAMALVFTGFAHAAALDLSGTFSSGASTVNAATVSMPGTPQAASEVAFYASIPVETNLPGTKTHYYSPDGGPTQYPSTLEGFLTNGYAFPTTSGSSPEFVMSWTSTAVKAVALAATFYDPVPTQGNMLLLMTPPG